MRIAKWKKSGSSWCLLILHGGNLYEENIDYSRIGSRIRQCRLERKISQETLADIVSVSRNYIHFIESGEKHVSLDVFVRIADTLKVSVDFLLGGTSISSNEDVIKVLEKCTKEEYAIITSMMKSLSDNLKHYRIEHCT